MNISITPPVYALKESINEILHPEAQYYDQGMLKVSDLHSVWYAQYGNPNGVPVIVLHGGPGFGCHHEQRFFDLSYYRIILLDQRGARRSLPACELRENTTSDLIADIEQLRTQLQIQQWLIFGGSWGTTLALAYGQAHPERCLGFIVRGVFLARDKDVQHLIYGMRDHYPDYWQEFVDFLPADEQHDLMTAYYNRLNSSNPDIQQAAAYAFMKYDLRCSMVFPSQNLQDLLNDNKSMLNVAKTFAHYCKNNFFLEPEQLLNNMQKINHLPAIIINGRFDVINAPSAAFELHKHWPKSELVFVTDGGHTSAEPGVSKALVQATERIKSSIKTAP